MIVYYSDGSYEELSKTQVTPGPISMFNNRCMVCGGDHGVNMQCPSLKVTSADLKQWEDQWKGMCEKYKPGQEDPGDYPGA